MTRVAMASSWTRGQWRAFLLLYVGYASMYFTRKPLSVAKGSMLADGYSLSALSALDTSFLCAYTLGNFAVGSVLGRRLSPFQLMAGVLCASFAATVVFVSSSWLPFQMLALAVNGAVQAFGFPLAANALWSFFTNPQEGGTVIGWWNTSAQVGSAASTLLASFVLSSASSWRVGVGGCGLVTAVASLALYSCQPQAAAVVDSADTQPTAAAAAAATATDSSGGAVPTAWSTLCKAFAVPTVPRLGVAYFLVKLVRYTLLLWLPFYLAAECGYSVGMAGAIASVVDVGGFAGSILCGHLTDKYARGRAVLVVLPMILGAGAGLALLGTLGATDDSGVFFTVVQVVLIALVGALVSGPDSALGSTATRNACTDAKVDARVLTSACGVVNGFGALGSVVQGVVTSAVTAQFGWSTLFLLLGVMCVAAAGVLLAPARRAAHRLVPAATTAARPAK